MNTYPHYKPSGINWIGEIPEHWEVKKLKYVAEIVLGKMLTPDDKGGYYLKPYLKAQNLQWLAVDVSDVKEMWLSENELTTYRVYKDDLLVSEGGEVGRTCIWNDEIEECYIQNSVNKVKIIHGHPRFYLFQFYSWGAKDVFNSIVNKVSIAHLTKEKLKEIQFVSPPLSEQTVIANYLDRKTAEIDQTIADKEALIGLYEEEKKGLINEAVTKGLNSNVPLKPSGIEWLGEIPVHWEVKKLKYVAKMVGGYAFDSDDFIEEGIQLIKIANLYQNTFSLERQPTFLPQTYLTTYSNWVVKKGDILMSMTGTLGKRDYGFAVLINTDEYYLLNQRVSKISFSESIITELGLHILHSEYFLNNLFLEPSGTKQGNFSNEQILNLSIAFPPLPEQAAIVDYIETETAKINEKMTVARQEIELLKEFRQALIFECVTGKVCCLEEAFINH